MKRIPPEVAAAVWDRDEERCQSCGEWQVWELRGDPFGWSIQHRVKRSHGVDNTLPNLLVLCGGGTTLCHGTVEAHPRWANQLGLGLWSWQTPAAEPIRTLNQTRWLTNDGQYSNDPPLEETA